MEGTCMPRGRPRGAKSIDWQPFVVSVPRCAHCGCTQHTKFRRSLVHVLPAGVTRESPADGQPYNTVTHDKSRCLNCLAPFPLVVRYELRAA